MSLNLQAVDDSATDQNLRQVAQRFPIQRADIADGAITDEKLASPPIRGQVTSAGVVGRGSGFSCSRTATGKFKIVLDEELSTVGVLTGTLAAASGFYGFITVTSEGSKEFTYETRGQTGALENYGINFRIEES